jgi:3-hydroxyacyl-CoA dehydrogenase
MAYNIRKAAVIGSGTMGGGIATLLAGVGIETMLLDIPAKDTNPGDPPRKRNAVVNNNLKSLRKMRPPQLFSDSVMDRISVGNIDDDLDKLSDADWIIEVIIEKLDIKQNLMGKLAEVVKPSAIISSNTSGLPINQIAEGLGEDFTRRFMGTHFFNPPRYLHLLEVIPHDNCDPKAVAFITDFATNRLGKGVVIAKDEPNFIGNRFMSMVGMQAMNYALDHEYTVEEVDAITGPLIGRPKTATFNLNDLVGFDIAVHVARNLYDAIPDDPAREVLNHPAANKLSDIMLENNWLGRKSEQGFYQMKREGGKKELWALNLQTMEYEPPSEVKFESVGKHRKVKDTGERIKLMMHEDDRAGEFLWHHHAFYLAYASNRVPEITETIVNIDNAQKWGFSHEMGPFEIWDAIGVEETIPQFEEAGYPVSDWVKKMVADGNKTFYQYDDNDMKVGYYSPQEEKYLPLEKDSRQITVDELKATDKKLDGNDSATIFDMGDGVLLWSFHSQGMAIDTNLIQMGYRALELLEENEDYKALVVGHDGDNFCVGANVFMVAMAAQSDELDQLTDMVESLQTLTQKMRYASKPVVVAPAGRALGGGVELIMAGSAVVPHMETYAGLVEMGVGLVPAGGGMKELVRRVITPLKASNANNDILPKMQDIFQAVSTAKVTMSALEAQEMGFIDDDAHIVMNRDYLLGEAKQTALELADGYVPKQPGHVWAAGRDVHAALLIGVEGFRDGNYATEYDAHIARKIAYVLTGGGLSEPQFVSEDYLMTLERDAFMSLVPEQKTLERIGHMLETRKPLRN